MTGTVPTELENLCLLSWLELSNRSFSGTVPTQLASLDRLRFFDVSDNVGISVELFPCRIRT